MSTVMMNNSSILSYLSVDQIKNVVNAKSKEEATYTGLWEKIVNYFCESKSEWAKEALYNLIVPESIATLHTSHSFPEENNNIEYLQRFAFLMNLADEDKRQDFSVKFTESSANNGKYDLSLYIGENKIRTLEIYSYTLDIENIEKEGPIIAATYHCVLQIFSKIFESPESKSGENIVKGNDKEKLKQPMNDLMERLREKVGGLALYELLFNVDKEKEEALNIKIKYFTDKYSAISQILHNVKVGDTTLGNIFGIKNTDVWSAELDIPYQYSNRIRKCGILG